MLIIYLSLIIASALCVILSKNMIQSVLYLILVFLLSSLLIIYLGAEFIGLIILVVYIGAIAVLFLFVVMLLNVRILELTSKFTIYLPLAILLNIIFIIQLIYFYCINFTLIEFNITNIYIN